MGQKDIVEKILLSQEDVFADIVNVLLFDGENVVEEKELTEQKPRNVYKADGKIREIERDVAKCWDKKRQNIRLAYIGIENQTDADKDMPLRMIAYDGAEYRRQIDSKNRYPVITFVLYFDYEKHWDKPLYLTECMEIPERIASYVNDYRINLWEIAYLPEETVELFQSDFRIIADYFVQMQKTRDYIPKPWRMKHPQEVLQFMSVMTGDYRFEEAMQNFQGKGEYTMCEVLDRIENRGIEKGINIGKAQGIDIGKVTGINIGMKLMQLLFKEGRYEEAERASIDEEFRKRLLKQFGMME